MEISSKAIVKLREPEGALVINLSKFPDGPLSCTSRIPPATAGVYAWFRCFAYPEDPDLLFKHLMKDIDRIKFAERTGSIKPYYELSLRSKSWISESKKIRIRKALKEDLFKNRLLETLDQSIFLQTPLYIGKSLNLKSRIEQHLGEESPLRTRLADAQIDISETRILLIPTEDSIEVEDLSSIDNDENQAEPTNNEELMEEILSRLFSPQFTLRLG
jgi:hypothetical protein